MVPKFEIFHEDIEPVELKVSGSLPSYAAYEEPSIGISKSED
jgi:hypothetical protein